MPVLEEALCGNSETLSRTRLLIEDLHLQHSALQFIRSLRWSNRKRKDLCVRFGIAAAHDRP